MKIANYSNFILTSNLFHKNIKYHKFLKTKIAVFHQIIAPRYKLNMKTRPIANFTLVWRRRSSFTNQTKCFLTRSWNDVMASWGDVATYKDVLNKDWGLKTTKFIQFEQQSKKINFAKYGNKTKKKQFLMVPQITATKQECRKITLNPEFSTALFSGPG